MSLRFLTLLLLSSSLMGVQAKDLAARIDYETLAIGADGVTRITRYSDQLIRRDNDSWLARQLPAGAHNGADHHKAEKGHKHMDIAAAARWVTRTDDGKLQVRLVNAHEKRVIDVPKTDYGNVGFDGEWSTASQLLGTDQVRKMKPLNLPAPAGSQWFEMARSPLTVRVLWDAQREFPLKIESTHSAGLYRSTVTATPQAMPSTLPWTQLKAYERKEYSDLLD